MWRRSVAAIFILLLVSLFVWRGPLTRSNNEAKKHDESSSANNQKEVTSLLDLGRPSTNRIPSEPSRSGPKSKPIDFLTDGGLDGSDSFQEEKDQFFQSHGITAAAIYKEKMERTAESPTFRFYVDRLKHQDSEKADEAFRLFLSAVPPRAIWEMDEELRKDSDFLAIVFHNMELPFVLSKPSENSFPVERVASPFLYELVVNLIPRLADPGQQNDALRLINKATLDYYADKEIAWWGESFQESEFAQLLLQPKTARIERELKRQLENALRE